MLIAISRTRENRRNSRSPQVQRYNRYGSNLSDQNQFDNEYPQVYEGHWNKRNNGDVYDQSVGLSYSRDNNANEYPDSYRSQDYPDNNGGEDQYPYNSQWDSPNHGLEVRSNPRYNNFDNGPNPYPPWPARYRNRYPHYRRGPGVAAVLYKLIFVIGFMTAIILALQYRP